MTSAGTVQLQVPGHAATVPADVIEDLVEPCAQLRDLAPPPVLPAGAVRLVGRGTGGRPAGAEPGGQLHRARAVRGDHEGHPWALHRPRQVPGATGRVELALVVEVVGGE